MILTITPNSALDKILFVDDFEFGQTVRTDETADGMGGKGAVTSWALGQLGVVSTATGFCGGLTGQSMRAMLAEKDVITDFVEVEGETRTNYVIARRADGSQGTITVSGYAVLQSDVSALEAKIERHLEQSQFALCGGSLPEGMAPDWYARVISKAHSCKTIVLADVSGKYMEPTFNALPDIIKPNEHEAGALLGSRIHNLKEGAQAALALQKRGIPTVIITMGSKGAVAATPEGTFVIPPLHVQALNTAGAGDSFNAGLLMGLAKGAVWENALRHAAATATAAVLTRATGAVRSEDVARLLPQVTVETAS